MTNATATCPEIKEVDAPTVKSWLDAGAAVLIDVREPDEYVRERIEGAHLVPLSKFNPAAVPTEAGKRIVLHCRGGRRSLEAASQLAGLPGVEVFSLKGGLQAWKQSGQPIVENRKAPISIMRQVQIVAGSLVLIGSLLGGFVSPWWFLLSGFVGAGFIFAGASGTCGMALLLEKMPWNRISINATPGKPGSTDSPGTACR